MTEVQMSTTAAIWKSRSIAAEHGWADCRERLRDADERIAELERLIARYKNAELERRPRR
jgi:hypothetical protein